MIGELDRVVVPNEAFLLHGKDAIEVLPVNWCERGSCLRRRNGELAVELGDVVIPQKRVRLFWRADILQPQFLRKPALPGTEVALTSSSSLRRVSRDHADTQFFHGPSDFGHLSRIHRLSRLGCAEEVAGTIAINRAEPALALDNTPQRRHH